MKGVKCLALYVTLALRVLLSYVAQFIFSVVLQDIDFRYIRQFGLQMRFLFSFVGSLHLSAVCIAEWGELVNLNA